jgi:hypothetical protein
MATVSQLPGVLNISLVRGDEFSTLVDFDVALTGYTFSAQVYSVLTGETLATPTVTAVNLATGQVNVSLQESQTASMRAGTYGWRLVWVAPGSAQRTALEGVFEVTT